MAKRGGFPGGMPGNMDDIEMLEDLIVAATNEALRKIDEISQASMAKVTGGLGGFGGFGF